MQFGIAQAQRRAVIWSRAARQITHKERSGLPHLEGFQYRRGDETLQLRQIELGHSDRVFPGCLIYLSGC